MILRSDLATLARQKRSELTRIVSGEPDDSVAAVRDGDSVLLDGVL